MPALTLVFIADTHELHRELDVPAGDILICAGDFTMMSRQTVQAIEDFNSWLGDLPHRHKIVTAGNHEFFLEADPSRRRLLDNATLLLDEGVEIEGLKIWGSPVTTLYGGAFGKSSPSDRARHWAKIPADTDVLITHGPPFGILDVPPGATEHQGDPELLAEVHRVQPRIHVFGHIHGGFGMVVEAETTFVNAALLGVDGALAEGPVVLRIGS